MNTEQSTTETEVITEEKKYNYPRINRNTHAAFIRSRSKILIDGKRTYNSGRNAKKRAAKLAK